TRVEEVRPRLTRIRAGLLHVRRPADRVVDRLPQRQVALEQVVGRVHRQVAGAVDGLRPEAALVDAVLAGDTLDLGGRRYGVLVELIRLRLLEGCLPGEVPRHYDSSPVARPSAARASFASRVLPQADQL